MWTCHQHTHTHTHTHTNTSTHKHGHIQTHIQKHTYPNTHKHRIHKHIHVYTQTHTYGHTHTHTHCMYGSKWGNAQLLMLKLVHGKHSNITLLELNKHQPKILLASFIAAIILLPSQLAFSLHSFSQSSTKYREIIDLNLERKRKRKILLRSKASFSFQLMTSDRQYNMENLTADT